MHTPAVTTIAREVTVKLLTAGATLSEAAFSGVGAYLLTGGRWLALGSAGCAAIIEWTVFSPNIAGGVRLLMTKDALLHRLIERELDKKLKQQSTNTFLQDYSNWLAWRDYYRALEHAHEAQKAEISGPQSLKECDDALKKMREQAAKTLLKSELDDEASDLGGLFRKAECTTFQATYQYKTIQLSVWCAAIPFAMVGAYFATYAAAMGILPMLPAAILATGAVVCLPYVIAGAAALAFGASILYTVHRMVSDDLLKTFWQEQVKSCKYGSWLRRMTLLLAAVFFVGMLAGLLLASAGTWWHAGMEGHALLFGASIFAAKALVGVMLVAYIALTQVFYIKNMIQSIDQLLKMQGSEFVSGVKLAVKMFFTERFDLLFGKGSRVAQAPWVVRPMLLLIAVPVLAIRYSVDLIFKFWAAAVFVAHCVSEGVTVDNSFIIPAIVAAMLRAIQEALTDLHYITELKAPPHDCQHEHEHEHGHGHEHGHSHGYSQKHHAHDHEHSVLPQRVLCIAFSPLLILLCAAQRALTTNDKVTFAQLFKPYWGGHDHGHCDAGQVQKPEKEPTNWGQITTFGKEPVSPATLVLDALKLRPQPAL